MKSFYLVFFFFSSVTELRSPKSEIVSHQLHDGSRILVVNFFDAFDIRNGIIEGSFSQVTSFLWLRLNFVVKYRKVKSQSKSDWVSGFHMFGSNSISFVITLIGKLTNFFLFFSCLCLSSFPSSYDCVGHRNHRIHTTR